MPEYDPVTKISIVPRGAAGGLTFFAPSEERLESGLYSRTYLENQMAVALGGRIAEELIFGNDDITTGEGETLEARRDNAMHSLSPLPPRPQPRPNSPPLPITRRCLWRLPAGLSHCAPDGDSAWLLQEPRAGGVELGRRQHLPRGLHGAAQRLLHAGA